MCLLQQCMRKKDYLDYIVLETLNLLYNSDGLRYMDLKSKLNISDTSLLSRLDKLKTAQYIIPIAKITDTGRNYIAYTLTDFGIQLVKEFDIEALLIKVENQLE